MLSRRLVAALEWLAQEPNTRNLPAGLFGASTGAAAALMAAAEQPERVYAVVSRGGRPDLAGDALERVTAPVLLVVAAPTRRSSASTGRPPSGCRPRTRSMSYRAPPTSSRNRAPWRKSPRSPASGSWTTWRRRAATEADRAETAGAGGRSGTGARPVVPEGRFPHRSRRITSAPRTADTLPAQPVTAFPSVRQARDQRRHGTVHHTKAPPRRGLSRSGARAPEPDPLTRVGQPLRVIGELIPPHGGTAVDVGVTPLRLGCPRLRLRTHRQRHVRARKPAPCTGTAEE